MSVKSDLFSQLSDYLFEKLQSTDTIPSVQWIDKDLGQAKLIQDGIIAMPLPAILVSFPTTNFDPQLSNDETGVGLLRIQTLFENYLDANAGSPNREMAISYFEFNERVHNAITQFKMQHVAGIARTGENEDTDHSNVIVTELLYHFTMYDVATNPNQYVTGNAKPSFSNTPPDKIEVDIPNNFIIP